MKPTRILFLTLISLSGLALAQNQPPSGWRRVGDAPPPAPQSSVPPATSPQSAPPAAMPPANTQDPSEPVDRSDGYGQTAEPQATMPQQTQPPANLPRYGVPPQLTLKGGTYVMVRINQALSTDHNQVGDTFSASLMSPLIVDGIVVANRGQIAYGRIAALEKQRSDRPSRMGLQLTSLTLADGNQLPITSQLIGRQGTSTPGGVQAGTIVGTTALGAAVGGAAAWGTGAAIGGAAGLTAGVIGVLLTRNHPTIVYPETALTFQLSGPVPINTTHSPQAFRYVGPEDYTQAYRAYPQQQPGFQPRPGPPASYYYGYGAPYPPPAYYYPYYWGPSVVIGGGWGWGWGGGWYGRRWR